MDDLEEKIQAVLNDPQQMQEIFSLARSLGLELPAEGGPPDGKGPEPPQDMPPQSGMPLPCGVSARASPMRGRGAAAARMRGKGRQLPAEAPSAGL